MHWILQYLFIDSKLQHALFKIDSRISEIPVQTARSIYLLRRLRMFCYLVYHTEK